MNKKSILLILTGILVFACGFYFFFARGTQPVPGTGDQAGKPPAAQQAAPSPESDGWDSEDPAETAYDEFEVDEGPEEHPKDIEEIKRRIYDLNIEYVEDIAFLEEVVQTGDAPTDVYWLGGWASVDDWKEETNGFNLEPQGDGTFIFYPDEATSRTYTFFETPRTYEYDPVKKEFFWETDYYGKTISHRARFINDDVLAMMLISGNKVTLDIYQKQQAENE